MFCHSCGKEVDSNSKFCHHCGANLSSSSVPIVTKKKVMVVSAPSNQVENTIRRPGPMTKEEYMARTNIKSVDEAAGYLTRLKILFISVAVGMVVTRAGTESIDANIYSAIWFAYIALLVYFVYFCVKVIKAEKIANTSAALSIIFAPISWIWFYPGITEPLKIIIGEKQPPHSLPAELSHEEREKRKKAADKAFWHKFKIVIGISFGVVFIICLLVYLAAK